MVRVFFPFQLSGCGAWKSTADWKSIARIFKRNKGYRLWVFSWKIWGVPMKNLHFKVADTSSTTSSMSPGTKMRWEPLLQSHSLAMSWAPQEIFPRGLTHIFHSPSLERLPSRAVLAASSAPGFPGENDNRWVSSHQAREQLFWFRFSINKSSESNTLCQLGQQQILECSGFSLFDKRDNPHPIPTQ